MAFCFTCKITLDNFPRELITRLPSAAINRNNLMTVILSYTIDASHIFTLFGLSLDIRAIGLAYKNPPYHLEGSLQKLADDPQKVFSFEEESNNNHLLYY